MPVAPEHVIILAYSKVQFCDSRRAVINPQQHRRMDLEAVDFAGAEPGCSVGFVVVGGTGLLGVG